MIELGKLYILLKKQNVDLAFKHLHENKQISTYDACVITTYLLKDTIGLRNTLKILYGFGLTHL